MLQTHPATVQEKVAKRTPGRIQELEEVHAGGHPEVIDCVCARKLGRLEGKICVLKRGEETLPRHANGGGVHYVVNGVSCPAEDVPQSKVQ